MARQVYRRLRHPEVQPWSRLRDRLRRRPIDLTRTLTAYRPPGWDAVQWAELRGDLPGASTLLQESHLVGLLEAYRTQGRAVLLPDNLERTAYYRCEEQYIRYVRDVLEPFSRTDFVDEADAFVTLYERIRSGDPSPVRFPSAASHSDAGSDPVVRATLTPGTFEIVDGHHRLAIAWVLGERSKPAVVLPPEPTAVQALVVRSTRARSRNNGQRLLYQPIDGPEFDASWSLATRSHLYLEYIVGFLARHGLSLAGRSVLDLGCRYGWYVDMLARHGADVRGVDWDGAGLMVGRITYRLPSTRLMQSDLPAFLSDCTEPVDVTLLLDALDDFAITSDWRGLPALLTRVDAITRSVLFLGVAAPSVRSFRGAQHPPEPATIVDLVRKHTAFTHVVPLDGPSPTLFACLRG
jgi:SAM-dependent methyltransferase